MNIRMLHKKTLLVYFEEYKHSSQCFALYINVSVATLYLEISLLSFQLDYLSNNKKQTNNLNLICKQQNTPMRIKLKFLSAHRILQQKQNSTAN